MSLATWIKIETTTPDKPEVIAISTHLKLDPDCVVGKLVRLWAWADQNAISNESLPITEDWIDRFVRCRKFAKILRKVGWLSGPDGALCFPRFERHNGYSAKARASEQRKKASQRVRDTEGDNCPHDCLAVNGTKHGTNVPPSTGQKVGPEEEIDIEECVFARARGDSPLPDSNKTGSPAAGPVTAAGIARRIVDLYPRKERQTEAADHVARSIRSGEDPAAIEAGTRAAAAVIASAPSGHLNRYVPSAAAFFREARWKDDPATLVRSPEKPKTDSSPARVREILGGRAASQNVKVQA